MVRVRCEASGEFERPIAYTSNAAVNQETLTWPRFAIHVTDGVAPVGDSAQRPGKVGWSIDLPRSDVISLRTEKTAILTHCRGALTLIYRIRV